MAPNIHDLARTTRTTPTSGSSRDRSSAQVTSPTSPHINSRNKNGSIGAAIVCANHPLPHAALTSSLLIVLGPASSRASPTPALLGPPGGSAKGSASVRCPYTEHRTKPTLIYNIYSISRVLVYVLCHSGLFKERPYRELIDAAARKPHKTRVSNTSGCVPPKETPPPQWLTREEEPNFRLLNIIAASAARERKKRSTHVNIWMMRARSVPATQPQSTLHRAGLLFAVLFSSRYFWSRKHLC